MSDWVETTLGKVCGFYSGDAFKKEIQGYADGDVPFIKVSDLNLPGNEIFINRANNWLDQHLARSFKVHPAGSVVFAKIGVALTYNRRRILTRDTLIDNNMMSAVPKGVDGRWFYYLMRTLDFNEISSGSALPYLTVRDLSKMPIKVPPFDEQREISTFLSALDNKIELSRRMNETLEAQARALFRDWFVDFGPVKAKVAGDTPYLPPDLWPLFPDRLNDQGLPEGWKRSTLGEIINVLETGKRPRGGVKGIDYGTPSVGAESIAGIGVFDFTKTKFVPEEFASKMNKGKVEDHDVLVYKDGGKPGELRPAVTFVSCGFPFSDFVINEHVFRARSEKISQEVLYCILTTENAFWQMKERATGVAQPGLNQEAMRSIEFVDPGDDQIWEAIHSLISPNFELCNRNALNLKSLAQTRDLLLPKLMSGEIRVGDVVNKELSAA